MSKKRMINLLLNVITDKKEEYYEQIGTVPVEEIPEVGDIIERGDRTFTVAKIETDADLRIGVRARNTRYIYLDETSPEIPTFEEIKARSMVISAARNNMLRERMKQMKLRANRKRTVKDG